MSEQQQKPTQHRAAQARHAARQQHLQEKRRNKGQWPQQPFTPQVTTTIDEAIPLLRTEIVASNLSRRTSNQNGRKSSVRKPPIPTSLDTNVVTEVEEVPSLKVSTGSYNREAFQDKVRAYIAIIFVTTFVGTIIVSFILAGIFSGNQLAWPNIKDLIQIIITTESALLGAAVGFYFGEKVGQAR